METRLLHLLVYCFVFRRVCGLCTEKRGDQERAPGDLIILCACKAFLWFYCVFKRIQRSFQKTSDRRRIEQMHVESCMHYDISEVEKMIIVEKRGKNGKMC